MFTEKIDTKVSKEIYDKLKADSKEFGRSFSGQIRFVIEQFYKCDHQFTIVKDGEFAFKAGPCAKCGIIPNPIR